MPQTLARERGSDADRRLVIAILGGLIFLVRSPPASAGGQLRLRGRRSVFERRAGRRRRARVNRGRARKGLGGQNVLNRPASTAGMLLERNMVPRPMELLMSATENVLGADVARAGNNIGCRSIRAESRANRQRCNNGSRPRERRALDEAVPNSVIQVGERPFGRIAVDGTGQKVQTWRRWRLRDIRVFWVLRVERRERRRCYRRGIVADVVRLRLGSVLDKGWERRFRWRRR